MGDVKTVNQMSVRRSDSHGEGWFGAPRGTRRHNGVDLCCDVGTLIASPIWGEVTKLGYPYADPSKSSLRYVEVTQGQYKFRFFYVEPIVQLGDLIEVGDVLGSSQELGCFYKGITEHVHFEIKVGHDIYIDPTPCVMMGAE